MPGAEAGSRASLLDLPKVRAKDGSSLPMAGHMRRITQLQSFPSLPYIYDVILLRLLRGVCDLGVEGNIE